MADITKLTDEELIALKASRAVPIPDGAMPSTPEAPIQQAEYKDPMFLDALKSAPYSLYKNTLEPLTHPLDMLQGMGSLAKGAYNKFAEPDVIDPSELVVDNFLDELKRPYTSLEEAEKTFREDPFRFLGDAAAVLYPAKLAGKASGVSALTKVGEIGQAIDPMSIAANAARVPFIDPVKKAKKLSDDFQSAAKWSTTMPHDVRTKITQTAIDNGLELSVPGVEKLHQLMGEISSPVNNAINAATESGVTIPVYKLARNLDQLRDELGGVTLKGKGNRATIRRLSKEFFEDLEKQGITELTPRQLQDFKTNAYKEINWDKDVGSSGYAENKFNEAMARAARQEIEGIIPGIAEQNRRLGDLLELQPAYERAVGRIQNRQQTPFMSAADMGGAGVTGGLVGGLGTSMLGGFDPMVSSALGAAGAGAMGYRKYIEHPLIQSQRAISQSANMPMGIIDQLTKPRPLPFWMSQTSTMGDRANSGR